MGRARDRDRTPQKWACSDSALSLAGSSAGLSFSSPSHLLCYGRWPPGRRVRFATPTSRKENSCLKPPFKSNREVVTGIKSWPHGEKTWPGMFSRIFSGLRNRTRTEDQTNSRLALLCQAPSCFLLGPAVWNQKGWVGQHESLILLRHGSFLVVVLSQLGAGRRTFSC